MVDTTTLFDSAVDHYVRHRLAYPPEMIADIVRRFTLEDGIGRVLDIGCGPGSLTFGLHDLGVTVTGIEPNSAMLAAAQRKAAELGADILFANKTAEAVGPEDGPARVALFGRSFHWTDRALVLARLERVLEPGGGVVIVHEDTRTRSETRIGQVVEALKRDWCPDGIPGAASRGHHEEFLHASTFSEVERVLYPVARRWTVDDAIGHMFSTSYFNPKRLGTRVDSFAIDARSRLLALEPTGLFEERLAFSALYATRPRHKGH
ncbi:class I SAM-dependent methyltransferase [Thalassobaculum salexigens]|uniref:class I SAM-dependent methyltransferase n=1 Tax=Thalassobaculum salexigens TaxID=455360 RepID=UPI00040F162B|nr:class I SAM-dependent methyltransferase [Thalassobaculum salexigens]